VSTPRILFILKHRDNPYWHESGPGVAAHITSGLHNSVRFVNDMLNTAGIESRLVQVVDNNGIDREVAQYKPTHVIIEGLWVVPEKFEVLEKLHPTVKWMVRIHSEVPFLAGEGIAVEWIIKYLAYQKMQVSCNAPKATRDLRNIAFSYFRSWGREKIAEKILYLPNSYLETPVKHNAKPIDPTIIDVACFGAVRPLKNQLIQAMAAIQYAEKIGSKLRFHINGTRTEQGGDSNIKNIRALFDGSIHELIEHPWMTHEAFLQVLAEMDISLCVSFTETFCIVAADSVLVGIPLVTSKEVPWANSLCQADPTDVDSITNTIDRVLHSCWNKVIITKNQKNLRAYCANSKKLWLHYLEKQP